MGYVIDITKQKPPTSVGNKALNIRRLANIGMRIPKTFAINWRAYHQYISDDANLVEDLKSELAKIIESDKTYAVRFSANIEDSVDRSFAGQFKSVLHVQGVDNVLQAAWSVWSSAQTPTVKTYLGRHNIPTQKLSMAVIVQEMVKPLFSGGRPSSAASTQRPSRACSRRECGVLGSSAPFGPRREPEPPP